MFLNENLRRNSGIFKSTWWQHLNVFDSLYLEQRWTANSSRITNGYITQRCFCSRQALQMWNESLRWKLRLSALILRSEEGGYCPVKGQSYLTTDKWLEFQKGRWSTLLRCSCMRHFTPKVQSVQSHNMKCCVAVYNILTAIEHSRGLGWGK